MAKTPVRRSSSTEIDKFLSKSREISRFTDKQARLLFAIDATASRQPTWDRACHLQGDMFRATSNIASLRIQLCYFRGINDFFASPWLNDSEQLSATMARVQCAGGHTQIGRLLHHALDEHRKTNIRALVFIGDAMEENADALCQLAGQCGLLKLPLFMFQEGHDGSVKRCYSQMARVSGGAYASFDHNSASTLAALLAAVASFAAGGARALENQASGSAKLLLDQLQR